jgi:cytosine/adenosine deaminase-related metal-dependent hydrolase
MQNLMDEIKNNEPELNKPKQIDSLIIYGGPVYDGLGNVYDRGSVYIQNDKISLVGEEEDVFNEMGEAMQNVETIDTRGRLVTPGLINAHHHLHMAFATGLTPLGPVKTFGERLENFIWPYEKALTTEAIQLSTLLTLLESIKHGVTTIFGHHSSPSSISNSLNIVGSAFERAGVRALLSYSITDKFGNDEFQEALNEMHKFTDEHRIEPLIKGIPGLHANFTLSEQSLADFAEVFSAEDGLHIHLGEAEADLHYCLEAGYAGCVDRLDKFDLLSDKSILAHANHLSEKDLEILEEVQPAIIHNPGSNANSGAGWFDLNLCDNIELTGLGTDGSTSNILGDLNKAFLLHNLAGTKNKIITDNLVKMLFENNAGIAARHFGQNIGSLEEGAKADVAIFDYKPHTLIHRNNINKHLVQGMQDSTVDTVIVNGKIIYKDKAYLTIDKEIVKKEASDICQSIWENYVDQAGTSNSSPTA